MIRTRRRPSAPAGLTQYKNVWTERWKNDPAGAWATVKARNILKPPLLALTWGKCAFCEGLLGAQAFPQIEHYISRKVAPLRAFEWRNLFPVCQVCNVSKGHEDHCGKLLKPDVEDPEPFFWVGPEGDIQPHPSLSPENSLRAMETIRLCRLNRGELIAARYEVASDIRGWLTRLTQDEWGKFSNPRHPYKLVIRHVLTLGNAKKLAKADRKLFHQ